MSLDIEAGYGKIRDGWFYEENAQWPGIALGLRINKILHQELSDFQKVLVFESTDHGNVLVLDGAIQCVEHDEFAYQEMITNLGMMSHPKPLRVLVIGGGDGGVLREVVKHDSVESADLCDIDGAVPRVSKDYLPGMAAGLDHAKATVTIGDGLNYIKDKPDYYDVIITDSSDPDGPAKALFEKPYYQDCYNALREGGMLTTQAETPWNVQNRPLIRRIRDEASEVFPVVKWAQASTPTYPYGTIGFFVMSKDPKKDITVPVRSYSQEEEQKLFKYYNKDIHTASFILPTFMQKEVYRNDKGAA